MDQTQETVETEGTGDYETYDKCDLCGQTHWLPSNPPMGLKVCLECAEEEIDFRSDAIPDPDETWFEEIIDWYETYYFLDVTRREEVEYEVMSPTPAEEIWKEILARFAKEEIDKLEQDS